MSKKASRKKRSGRPGHDETVDVNECPTFLNRVLNFSISFSNRQDVRWFSLLLLALSVLAYYPTNWGDYDIWWHLKYGEHFVKNVTWNIDHSVFSWTPANPDWQYSAWLGSSIFYIAYQIGSAPALYVVQWLIFLSILATFLYYIKTIGDSLDVSNIMGLILVAIAINPPAIYIKPEQFTILFFSLAVFIYFYSKLLSKNLFLFYPLLFLIWVNAHGGFIIGLFFISLALCGEMVNYFFLKKDHMPKRILILFLLSVVVSYITIAVNPYGIEYPAKTIKGLFTGFLFRNDISHLNYINAYTNMWEYLFPKVYKFRFINAVWTMLLMAILFLYVTIYAYWKKSRFDISVVMLNVAFFMFSMSMARATIFFPLMWLFTMLYMLKKADALQIKKKFTPIALLILLFWVGNSFYNTICCVNHRSWFGSNIDELTPLKEVTYIKENKLPGPIFNDYLTGGYMIWAMYPDYKVFIDPRYRPYAKQVWPDWVNLERNLKNIKLKEFTVNYPFNIALIHLKYSNLISWLLRSTEWRLAYFDKVAAVVVHRSVFNSVRPEAFTVDLGPERFKDVKNPMTLALLFNFYNKFISKESAFEIFKIYKQNVSDLYLLKKKSIATMERHL